MEKHEVEAAVLDVVNTVLKTSFTSLENVGRGTVPIWDSLKHIEIVLAIEEALGVEFAEEELAEATTAEMIVDIVCKKHAA